MVLYPAVSLVSSNPEGSHDHTARDARALAQGRLSSLLALEIASTGRAAASRDGAARADPADEYREPTLGRATHSRTIRIEGHRYSRLKGPTYLEECMGPFCSMLKHGSWPALPMPNHMAWFVPRSDWDS